MKKIYLLAASILVAWLGYANPSLLKSSVFWGDLSNPVAEHSSKKPKPKPSVKKFKKQVIPFAESQPVTTEESSLYSLLVPTITATKSVTVNGGGNPVPGGQLDYTILVSNSGTNATAVSVSDILSNDLTLVPGSIKASPIAVDDAYDCIGNVGINVPAANAVLVNDINPESGSTLQATATNTAGTQGTVVMNPDGSFTFVPSTGFSGTTTFTYTVSNGHFARTATVTITVSAPIWFVKNNVVSNGDGSLANPFKQWSDFGAANTGAAPAPQSNHTIFVYTGTGDYTGTATLRSGQKVLGQGATTTLASFAGITIPTYSSPALPTTSGAKPNLTSSGTTITLSTNNTLRGFDMGNSTKDIVGSSFGTLTASEMALAGNGQALDLSSGSLACTFTSISSTNSAAEGINFSSITGSLTSTGGTTTTNSASFGIAIYGGSSVNANFGNTTLSGSGATALLLSSTGTTPTTTFGSLNISPDANVNAIQASGNNGTITCTSGTITTSPLGTGISFSGPNSSTKPNLNIVFTTVSVTGGSASGIILNNTSGSFTIAGTGSAGTGGTIQNNAAESILINNASAVSLNYLNISNSSKSCYSATNLSGICAINNCTFSLGAGALSVATTPASTAYGRRCVHILNKDVTLTLNVNGSTFNGQLTTSPSDNHGIAYETTTDASSSTIGTLNIKTSTFNRFNNYAVYTTSTGSAITDVGIQGSSVNYDGGTTYVGGAFRLYNLRSAKTTFNILNNTSILTKGSFPVEFYSTTFDGTDFTPASGRGMEGKFNGNTLTRHSTDGGTGVNILVKGRSNAVVQVSNNTIIKGSLSLQAVENTPESTTETPRLDATVTDNTIEELLSNYGIDVLSGGPSATGFSTVINCVKISGNDITPRDAGGLGLIRFFTNGPGAGGGPNVIWLDGANGTTETSLVNYWNNNSNTPTGVTSSGPTRIRDAGFGGTGNKIFRAAGTCLTPTNAAPARIAVREDAEKNSSDPSAITTPTEDLTSKDIVEPAVEEAILAEVETPTTPQPQIESTNAQSRMMAGETVTVNGSGSGFNLPAGKNTTITFSATIGSTPSTCAITNQATVSGSNFSNVNSNTTTTNVVVPPINSGSTISATSVCTGGSINLGATCPSGSQLNWFTASSGGSSVSTSSSYSPTNITASTSYYASCTIGGCESARTLVGSVTVTPNNTITLTSAAGTNAQTRCINTAITNITYATTGATGATFSGLPTGVTGVWASNVVTISGSPSTATGSPFNYTVTLTGGCGTITATGTITVTPNNTVNLTSAAGTNAQTVCINTPITNITYATTGATGASFSGLPTGVTGSWASNVVTISGSPSTTIGSPFNYTVTLTGGCGTVTATGSITVNPNNTVSLTSAAGTNTQTKCVNTPITNITYATTGATGATFSGLPTGVTGVWASNVVTISGSPTTATGSPFSYTVTLTGGCGTVTATGTITVNSTPAPTSPLATPSNITISGNTTTLTASGCSSPSTISWFDAANPSVALPNNTPAITATKTFFAKCTGTNTCVSDASTSVTVTYNPCTPLASSPGNIGINWTGLISTDWNNACNWNPAWVPDATNSAVVIDSRTNQPTISGTVPSVKLIYVNSGATLTVASGGTLNANSTTAVITLQGGNLINDGAINLSGGGTSIGIAVGATASITNRGTITTNNLYGASLQFGDLTFTNESMGVFNGDFKANANTLTLTNRGTINYAGGTYALSLGSAGSSVINTGTINITGGSGISNPSGSTITNNTCGKIITTINNYENAGTTTNAGLIQLSNTHDFTNSGTFTNNGVLKANSVSGITNNRMVITNACPIFTLGGSNNYTVSGIFSDAGATTSAGTYTSVGNKFTANNTIPSGTQTLYAQVTNVPAEGFCTFIVPFGFNNVKPTAVSVNRTTVCPTGSVTLSGTCASGTLTWYTTATGGSSIGTGTNLSNSPTAATTYYASCETTNCVSGRVATDAVTIVSPPTATATPNAQTICSGNAITTIAITGTGTSYTWTRDNTTSATGIAASGSGDISGSLTNTTEAPITVTFTITPVSVCNGTPITATVVVNPIPTVVASTPSQTICSGTGITGIRFNIPTPVRPLTPDPTSDVVPTTPAESIQGIGLSSFVAGTVFNWTRDNTATVTGIPASGTGNITGVLINTTASPITVTFTVTPSYANDGKVCTGTPITVTVTVNPNPTAPTITDTGTAFCSGSSTTLTASTNPTYTSYAWERSLTGIANPNSFTAFGGTAQTQVVTTSGVYRVVVGNQYNCFTRDTTAVKFGDFVFNGSLAAGDAQQTGRMNRFATVSTCATPTTYPGDFTTTGSRFYDSYTVTNPTSAPLCATIGLTSGCGTTLFSAAYLGSYNPTSLGTNYLADHGSTFPGTAFYEATIPANGTIVVVVHEVNPGTGCSNYNLRIDVPGATIAPTANSNSPICAGNTLNLTGTGTGTYAWSGPNSFTSTEQNPSIANATTLATGTYTISVTNTSGCVFNATTAVTVNGISTASATPNAQTICSGNAITTIAITGTGTSYTWTRDNTGSVTGIAASGSGDISGSLTNTTEAPITVTFTITPVGLCSGTPITATVVVNPIPTVVASTPSQSICSGANITGITFNVPAPLGPLAPDPSSDVTPVAPKEAKGIVLSGFVAGTVFNWTRDNTAIVTSPTIGASGTGNISGRLTNTTASPVTVTFTITPSYTNAGTTCTGTPITVTVTVNPNPASATITDAGTAFCSGVSTTLSAPADPNYTYAWERSLTGIAAPNSFTSFGGTAQTQVITTSGVYRAIVTNQYNCSATDTTAVKFGDFVFNGSLVTGDAQQTGRMNRFAVVSTCAAPKTYPGDFTISGARFYDSYTVTNPTSAPLCATIGLTSGCGTTLFSAAYLGSYNPTSLGTNYLADHGSTFPGTAFYEATIPANGTIVVIVHEVNPGTGCSNYNLRIDVPGATIAPTANSNSPICAGNTLNLTGTGTGTYAWSGPNSFTSTEQNPSIANATTLATGTYTISVTNTSGCVFNATTAVTVNALPTATATSNSPICSGTTLNLTGGGVGTAYAWVASNGYTSTEQSPSILNAAVSSTGTYTITVTNANGCTSTASVAVTVNPLPTATATNNSPICSGATLNLTGGGGVSYAWAGPSYTSTEQSPSITNATASMSGTYTVTVTNSNGCISTATTSVTVNPAVSPPTPQANTQIIFGGSVTLTATGCSGVNDVLKWYQSADNLLVTMPVSPTTTSNYYAKCETTLNGITCISGNSSDVTVTVLSPTPPVATGATNCLGTPTTLTATGCSGSVGTFVLKWYQNSDDALVTMPVSPLVSTDYYAKCEQTFNSVTAVSAKSNVVTLTILNPPIPVSTGGTIYNSQSISLTATGCTGTLGTFTLRWYQTSDNALVTMPVSPTVTTQYYSKCEQTANSVTCLSAKSNDVTVTVVNRIFVDITKVAAPIQNGNTWATAYGNLQTGLAAATAGVEVWVAKGTYKTTATNTRTIYFNIPNNVIVYGGFAGTENALSERDFRTNESILSGEIGNLGSITDNSYHVVVFDGSTNNTVLDGFTITGGNASFDPNRSVSLPVTNTITTSTLETGGGIMAKNAAAPIIVNCTFTKNSAIVGGGLFAADASLVTITHCKFNSNQATFGSGIYLQDGSIGTVSNTLLNGNRGIGSFYNNNSSPQISNCTIAGNGGYSGGIFNSNSSPVVINSIIWGNAKPINDTQSIITYSIVEGGYAGIGNLNYDPQFVDPNPEGISPTTNGNFQLKEKSLAIDRGLNGTITLSDKDLAGNPRRYNGGRVDMGAYEYQGVGTANLLISITSGNWESGLTWDAGRSPQIGDIVIIDQNHTVTINSNANAQNVEYRGTGTLRFGSTTSKLNIGL